ncbi:jg15902 [Pararge aegeria aegeria]|uniref:Jg15902 protein n=1 Tax=Pararge aegeria aegeria TaxID=348720 RepID=A0A8S4QP84_9NEOP|nr:jg15902 [Pararge aegeria aegeria]
MVVIAVDNIPLKMNLKEMVRSLASTVKCHFDALNFTQGKNFKTAFLRLPEKQNPNEVIKRLNNKILKKIQLRAYIPSIIPNLPLSHKTRTIPTKMRRKLKIAANLSDDQLKFEKIRNSKYKSEVRDLRFKVEYNKTHFTLMVYLEITPATTPFKVGTLKSAFL